MRWIGALAWRAFAFWGLWFALIGVGSYLMADHDPSAAAWGRMARVTLFLATMALLGAEAKRVNLLLYSVQTALTEAGLPVPGRLERATHGFLPLFLNAVFWTVTIRLCSSSVEQIRASDVAAGRIATVLGALGWSLATLSVVALVLGGITVARFRLAAWTLPEEKRPALAVVLPWTVAAWSSGALLLALVGAPEPRHLRGLARLADATLQTAVLELPDTDQGTVELLVQLGPDDHIGELRGFLAATEASATQAFPGVAEPSLAATWVVTVPAANAPILAWILEVDDEDVSLIELNAVVTAGPLAQGGNCTRVGTWLPVDDPLAPGQPELVRIGAGDVFPFLAARAPSARALVALVDTGVSGANRDLSSVMTPRALSDDRRGHGTACASLIGAAADNGWGIASLNYRGRYVKIRSYPALAEETPNADDVAAAIWWAAEDGADVVNLSFSARGQAPTAVGKAVAHAQAKGAVVVAAAGNDRGMDASGYWPANMPGVLAVGATDGAGRAAFSNTTRSVALSVSAPGQDVCALTVTGDYARTSGTSAAAPLVSGLLATMRALCPSLGGTEAIRILRESGQDMSVAGLGPAVRADQALALLVRDHPECAGVPYGRAYRGSGGWDD